MLRSLCVVFGFLFLVQVTCATSQIYNNHYDVVEEIISPIKNELIALKQLIQEVEQYQQVHEIYSSAFTEKISKVHPDCLPETPFIETWIETDVCFNMSTTLSIAADLSENVTAFAVKAAINLGNIFLDFINCNSINPITAVECMMTEFEAFKQAINEDKPICLKYKDEIVQVFSELREEFDECLGIRKARKVTARKLISAVKTCESMKIIDA